MRVSFVSYRRVRSDNNFGCREFVAEVEVEPGDDAESANALAQATVEQAMAAESEQRRAGRWPDCVDAEGDGQHGS